MTDQARTDAERAERKAAQRQAWNDAHPTYYADYQERNREHIRKTNRERERQRAQRERDEKERRRRGIERAKEWAQEHPEERQQARERYKQKHPEAHKQAQREYYYRNREAIAERRRARDATDPQKANEARRRAAARARAAGRVSDWSPSPSQRESYRQRENEARRFSRRRARAGLPDRRLHRVLAAERRHNAAAADAFFTRKRSRDEIARIREQDAPTPPELVHAMQRQSEDLRAVREVLAMADAYFTDHELELRARVAEISRTRFRAGLLPLDVYTEPRRRALEVASTGYLRPSAVSPTSSIAVFQWLTSDLAERAPDILL
ncbi:hypothetical protein [Microbacterium wangruii]|uniref:hypothetical protein n=1 Tax=Microbacterium wangruii TaxID=3049073 RepID=UPI00256EB370|nr:hypothetical protein [Microbacterium sp. zg-Y1211]MDL5486827.1 hypothetical protein [Microbacterium sp. zg-Y1211]